MFTVTKSIEFDAAHRVPHHKSKCYNLHGHRYRVEAQGVFNLDDDYLSGKREGQTDEGMVVDFGDLKKVMTECIHDPYDHSSIFWKNDPVGKDLEELYVKMPMEVVMRIWLVDFIPTAENLARHFWEEMTNHALHVNQALWTLNEVAVWETPTSKAVYRP
jgi:6-pyruvoyltetrahydropterin/6-carboxytetrahydropterin synthase